MEMGSPMLTSVIEATVASLKDPTPPVKLIGALLGSDFTLMLTVFVEISLVTVRVKKEGNPKPLASSSRRRPTVAGPMRNEPGLESEEGRRYRNRGVVGAANLAAGSVCFFKPARDQVFVFEDDRTNIAE
jgi:hypothetical protein